MKSRSSSDSPSSLSHDQSFAGRGLAFLLSQVGAHASRVWIERLRAESLDARQVMLVWNVARTEGLSQRDLARALRLPESRVVGLVDALAARGWLERRINKADRRARAIHMTTPGREMLDRILDIAAGLDGELGQALTASERKLVVVILAKIATAQGLVPAVHPDF